MYNLFLIIYILIVYVIFCGNKGKIKNSQNIFLVICFITFFLFVGWRSVSTGSDTIGYINSFKQSILHKWDYFNISRFEKGFLSFQIILGYLTSNARLYLIILSGIFNYGIYKFIKNNSNNYLMSVLMYVCLLFYYDSMTMIRQFFAMIIMLYAFKFIKNKKMIPFIIAVLIAMQFHITAIVCILLYPIYSFKYSRKAALFLIILSILALIFIVPLVERLYSITGWNYTYEIRDTNYSLANILYACVYLTMLIISKRIISTNIIDNKENDFYLYIFLLSGLLNFVAIKMNIFSRISEYYTIFSIIALPNIIQQIANLKSRNTIKIIIFTFLVVYSIIITTCRSEWNTAFNYKFYTFDTKGESVELINKYIIKI